MLLQKIDIDVSEIEKKALTYKKKRQKYVIVIEK
jgi:hypothetical protein